MVIQHCKDPIFKGTQNVYFLHLILCIPLMNCSISQTVIQMLHRSVKLSDKDLQCSGKPQRSSSITDSSHNHIKSQLLHSLQRLLEVTIPQHRPLLYSLCNWTAQSSHTNFTKPWQTIKVIQLCSMSLSCVNQ